jgi:hypothetical protein
MMEIWDYNIMNIQIEFEFMKDLLTAEELMFRAIGEQSRKEFDFWLISELMKIKL